MLAFCVSPTCTSHNPHEQALPGMALPRTPFHTGCGGAMLQNATCTACGPAVFPAAQTHAPCSGRNGSAIDCRRCRRSVVIAEADQAVGCNKRSALHRTIEFGAISIAPYACYPR